jgi:hypothetical protein
VAKIVTLEQLGPALEALVGRSLPLLYHELRAEVSRRVFAELVTISPVGNPSVDKHSGKYRASHVPSAGQIKIRVLPDMPSYPIPGDEVVDAVTSSATPGTSVFIANAARSDGAKSGYAGILEGGRRMYSRVATRRAQWVGSEQAPEGVYGPAVRAIKALRATIEASAIRRVKERL